MTRSLIDASTGPDGTLHAVSTSIPAEDEEFAAVNRLHESSDSGWRVAAEWVGWAPTALAVTRRFALVSGVKQHLFAIRNGEVECLEHPDPERALHCISSDAPELLVGGSAGYYLVVDRETGAIAARHLRELGVEKPGRDLYAIHGYRGGLAWLGSSRLALVVTPEGAVSLLPPGPTASNPSFHSAAVFGGRLYAAAWGELWRHDGETLVPLSIAREVAAQIGALAAEPDGLLVGGDRVLALSPDGALTRPLFDHPGGAHVVAFVGSPGSRSAVFADGLVVSLGASARVTANVLGRSES